MRKIAASSLAALAVVGGMSVVQAPAAEAAGRHCVSKPEYRKVYRGMSRHRVERVFDTRGGFADGWAGGYSKMYRRCRNRGNLAVVVVVDYRNGKRVIGKRQIVMGD